MVGTIIWTIPKPDNNNENNYDWIKALLHCIRIIALIHYYSRDFSAATQGLDDSMAADDLMARQYKQTFSIQADVLDTTRGCGLGSTTWWYNGCYDDEMSEKAMMQIGRQIAKGILSKFDSF